MMRGLKGLFGKRTPEEQRKARNDQIKAILRDWQGRWHDIFDKDQDLIAAGEFERPDPLPADIDGDFRLIFGLSRATRATRQKCFGLFPSGDEMEKRFDAFLTSKPVPLPEAEAKAGVQRIKIAFEEAGLSEEVNFANVRVVDRSTPEGLAVLQNTDDIAVLIETEKLDAKAAAARVFLTEPLYASAGNYYDVRDWVTAAMQGGREDSLRTDLYNLWSRGWQVHFDDNGIVLAHRKL